MLSSYYGYMVLHKFYNITMNDIICNIHNDNCDSYLTSSQQVLVIEINDYLHFRQIIRVGIVW